MMIERPDCPACGAEGRVEYRAPYREVSKFLSDYYARPIAIEGEYSIRRCGRCGTVYQGEVGDAELLSALYGEWLSGPEDAINLRDIGEIRLVAAFLKRPVLKTLDYGMGTGVWAEAAKQLGHRSHGFDLSDGLMAKARAKGISTKSAHDFDFINTEQVFEHLAEPRAVINELAGRLRPGGILKISVPSQQLTKAALKRLRKGEPMGGWIMPVQPLEHVNNFSRTGLKMMAGAVGLKPVRPGLALQYRVTPKTPKELLRPLWRWLSPGNTYMWFRKAG